MRDQRGSRHAGLYPNLEAQSFVNWCAFIYE